MIKAAVIIPARLKSERFPNKLLHTFCGKSIIQTVIDNTKKLNFSNRIILATKDTELIKIGKQNNLEIFETTARYGTEKIFNYYKQNPNYDYYISIPADEPTLNPDELNKFWEKQKLSLPHNFIDTSSIGTFYTDFYCLKDLISTLSCKIVTNKKNFALYFSRNIIPATKNNSHFLPLSEYKKHVGVFIFPQSILKYLGSILWNTEKSKLAEFEGLEQNRFLDFGIDIIVYKIFHIGFGIDQPHQIKLLEKRLSQ